MSTATSATTPNRTMTLAQRRRAVLDRGGLLSSRRVAQKPANTTFFMIFLTVLTLVTFGVGICWRARHGVFLSLSLFVAATICISGFDLRIRVNVLALRTKHRCQHQRCSRVGSNGSGWLSTLRVFEVGTFGLLRKPSWSSPKRSH